MDSIHCIRRFVQIDEESTLDHVCQKSVQRVDACMFMLLIGFRLEWPVRALSFSHDCQLLASASEDLLIDIAHVETGEGGSHGKYLQKPTSRDMPSCNLYITIGKWRQWGTAFPPPPNKKNGNVIMQAKFGKNIGRILANTGRIRAKFWARLFFSPLFFYLFIYYYIYIYIFFFFFFFFLGGGVFFQIVCVKC